MKHRIMVVIIGTLVFVCGGAFSGLCGDADELEPSVRYAVFVDNYIKACEAKAQMLDSGSPNIRNSAVQDTLKGFYLQSNRDAMIQYLMEKNVPFNPHRIAYHLTQKYTESAFSQHAYALLLEGRFDQKEQVR